MLAGQYDCSPNSTISEHIAGIAVGKKHTACEDDTGELLTLANVPRGLTGTARAHGNQCRQCYARQPPNRSEDDAAKDVCEGAISVTRAATRWCPVIASALLADSCSSRSRAAASSR